GHYPLEKLMPLDIQRLYTELQRAGSNHHTKGQPLSAKSIKNIHSVLRKALAQVVRWRLLVQNPAEAVSLPRCTRPTTTALNPTELQRLMLAITPAESPWRIPLLIAIGTGMRRGEIRALQWQDFDPEQRLLVVRRALSPVTNSQIVVKGTKTGKIRVVALNDSLVQALNQHRDTTKFNTPRDWICCRENGDYHRPVSFSRDFTQLMGTLKLKITLHGLRHTHATALLAAGIPVKVISERLGHASVIITQDIYAHVLPTMQREAADVMENIWMGGRN
ncbi:MAG TPA: site-specific integrase, partial [Armatimonadota bacterium]